MSIVTLVEMFWEDNLHLLKAKHLQFARHRKEMLFAKRFINVVQCVKVPEVNIWEKPLMVVKHVLNIYIVQ